MIKNWIQSVVSFLLLMSLVGQLTPEEKYRKYIHLTMGFLLILVMLRPVTKVFGLDETVFQHFIESQMDMASANAKSSASTLDIEQTFIQTYENMLRKEVETYFESVSVDVQYCHIEMNENLSNENYGKIEHMRIGISIKGNKDVVVEKTKRVEIEPIQMDNETVSDADLQEIPKEKFYEWKKDLILQFGLKEEQLALEIIS